MQKGYQEVLKLRHCWPFCSLFWEIRAKSTGGSQPKKNVNVACEINYLEDGHPGNGSYDKATANNVSTIGGIDETPFVMKGKIKIIEFTAMIPSGSLVTNFTM